MVKIGISAIGSGVGRGGGTDVYALNLVRALSSSSSDFSFVLLVDKENIDEWAEFKSSSSITIRKVYATRFELLKNIFTPVSALFRDDVWIWRPQEKALAANIDSLELDLIHFPRTSIYPMSINTRSVLTFFDLQHIIYPQFFSLRTRFARNRRYKYSLESANRIIVPSTFTAETMYQHFDISLDKISIIPVGISQNWGQVNREQIENVRAKYNLPDKYIYYPANPWPHKNHERLLRAVSFCATRFGIKPIIVFTGKLVTESRSVSSLVGSFGLEQQVIDLGFVEMEDLPSLYSGATMMVFPSIFEGFGIPLLEAMACGCPIAASNVTSIPEVVKDAALLFDPYDIDQIAESIKRLYCDLELQAELTRRGVERVKSFHWNLVLPKILNVFSEVVNGGR